jgi:phosphoglycolate phosphatase
VHPTVLLFDIDGTLLTTGGAGRRALQRTFAQLHGRGDALEDVRLDGMTDHAIVRIALERIGAPFTDEMRQRVLDTYVEHLADEVARAEEARYRAHEGIRELLERVSMFETFALGLGTGNIQRGARIKLERVGLNSFFSFGGFGCDAEDRSDLVRSGALRGAQKLGQPLERCRVVIIGDTPKDISAARALRAECVAVGTGAYSPQMLREAGAQHAFETLRAPGALEAILGASQ